LTPWLSMEYRRLFLTVRLVVPLRSDSMG
jgi:hypothetical protein